MSDSTDKALGEMLNGNTEGAGSEKESTEANASENTQSNESAQTDKTEIDWKAESRKWEERAKSNRKEADELKAAADKAAELEKQLEEAKGLTSKEIAAREEAIEKANLEVTRFKIAAQHGVSAEDVELFLTGSDEETLEKQAQRISQHSANAPKPDPRQGKREGSGTPSTAEAFANTVEGLFN